MAVVAHSLEALSTFGDDARVVVWSPMANGDTGQPFEMPGASDRTVHFSGTTGAGGTVIMQGSNHASPGVADTDWFPLTDPQGNAISKTAISTGEAILELTRWIRPKVTAGDGSTAWQVRLLAKK